MNRLQAIIRGVFAVFSSLRLTVALLAVSMVMVFIGTIAQVYMSEFVAQTYYLERLITFGPPDEPAYAHVPWWLRLPMPGGFLLGGLLVVNLLCAHFRYFKFRWRKLGIALTHGGLVVLIISGFLVSVMKTETFTTIGEGDSVAYHRERNKPELVFVDMSPSGHDREVAIPTERLADGATITDEALPFTVRVVDFQPNSSMHAPPNIPPGVEPQATRGPPSERGYVALERPRAVQRDGGRIIPNVAAALVEIEHQGEVLGRWLLSELTVFDTFWQTVDIGGAQWRMHLRQKRHYLPYDIHLTRFIREAHPGTNIPARFVSEVRLERDGETIREATIAMNEPLRHDGLTFYQYQASISSATGQQLSGLMVVRNASWWLPYIAVGVVGLGLCVQFGMHLLRFMEKRLRPPGKAPAAAPAQASTPVKEREPETQAVP
jgi:hypothetical protein